MSTSALTVLLAACGSGGEDTGGGGGGGGGSGVGGRGARVYVPVAPTLSVRNDHTVVRTQTIRASVPFSESQWLSTDGLSIDGHPTAWQTLQRWPDGTIRVAQAQFTDTIEGRTGKTYQVVDTQAARTGAFEPNGWMSQFGGNVRIGAQVEDRFGVRYSGVVSQMEELESSPLVRVRRARLYHQPSGGATGIGRDFLTSTFYVHEFRDMPIAVVDWIVGNDYQGADDAGPNDGPNMHPLGGVDVNAARFLIQGAAQVRPFKGTWHGISAPDTEGGFTRFQVMSDTYIDDGQTRRYRFLYRVEDPSADPTEKQRWRDTLRAMAEEEMFAIADAQSWRDSLSLGLLGGPIEGPADAWDRCEAEYQSWVGLAPWGTWATYGDVKNTNETGTPRNHPICPDLGHAIQGQHHRILNRLMHMAWVQAVRPYHLWQLEVRTDSGLLLWDCPPVYPGSRDLSQESLGRRALVANNPYAAYRTRLPQYGQAHDWKPYDHEHWSSDLLFDYWTMTGDPWAKEELRMLGECLKGLMVLNTFATANIQSARAEGWTMQGFVQSYLATQDPSLKDFAIRRATEIVDAQRNKTHPSRAMVFQRDYPGTGFGPAPHEFFMPWQHGAVLYGFVAAWYFFEDEVCLGIAEDVARCVEYSWVQNFTDPTFGLVENGLRYYVPISVDGQPCQPTHFDSTVGVKWGDSPLGGAHTFLTGGLLILARDGENTAAKALAEEYGGRLFGGYSAYYDGDKRWNKWNLAVPEDMVSSGANGAN